MTYVTMERAARAFLTHLSEPGDMELGRLVLEHGAMDTLQRITLNHEISHTLVQRLQPRWPRGIITNQDIIDWYTGMLGYRGARLEFLIPGDAKWPTGVDDLGKAAPFGLWVRGDAQALAEVRDRQGIAVVGARAATSYGEHVTAEIVTDLVGAGHPIVSGAAYGIDGAAHRTALAAGGITVAFLAAGADRPYPMGHAQLIDRIAERGAVASEVPPGSAPTKYRFLARNRLVAAASAYTLVVEAGWRSGSIHTATETLSLARPLGAVPGPITSAASTGCHRIIAEMHGRLITSAADIALHLAEVTPEPAEEEPRA